MNWFFKSKSKSNKEDDITTEIEYKDPVETLHKLLATMDCKATVEQTIDEANNIMLNISTDEARMVIGEKGETLYSLQYLLNKILYSKNPETPRVIVDVDQYRSKRKEKLITMAQTIADKVKNTGKPSSLPPLNPFDRKTVHESLHDDNDVNTNSPGEGYFKKILVSINRVK